MNNQNATKIQELFADKAFVDKVVGMDTSEEVKKALAERGVDISVDDIENIRQGVVSQLNSGEELDPSQLKNVAGGLAVTTIVCIVAGAITAASTAGGYVHSWTDRRW